VKRIMITGARGFLGTRLLELAPSLLEARWDGIDREEGDLCDPSTAVRLVAEIQPDHVVHLAGLIGQPTDPAGRERMRSVNVDATRNLLRALESRTTGTGKTARFVFASSGLVYGAQPGPWHEDLPLLASDPYASSKREAEALVADAASRGAIQGAILRPALVYGPSQTGGMFMPSLVAAMASGREFPMTPGEQRRDYLHVDDLVRAVVAVLALDRFPAGDGGPWIANVGSGAGTTLLEIAAKAQELARGLWNDTGSVAPGSIPYRPDESWDYRLDSTRLREATGWAPRIGLEDGIRQCLEAARSRLATTRNPS